MKTDINANHKAQKRYDLWNHVCKCHECKPTENHEKLIKEVVSQLIKKGLGNVLKFHNEKSGGRGLLDPMIANGYEFCDIGRLFFAAYKEWDVGSD